MRGQPAARRAAARQAEAAPEIAALRSHLEQVLGRVSGKFALASAIRYALSRWPALTRYLADDRLEIDNNIAERANARRGCGPEELVVRWPRRRRRGRGGLLNAPRDRQEQRP
ncbi:hypothetical protein J2851_004894 [Azospirillum rugosum]|uniref:Transposase IS66 central domain-containing protein n=1 Tax=Azospirillum rugosum TaxID=416170 RepID=A0ABS4SR91_9PROT|nr:hypothetical protein [Azospirillum rugosum]MDQ0528465.1 hypothetical protein [Azospirillum rugosum]